MEKHGGRRGGQTVKEYVDRRAREEGESGERDGRKWRGMSGKGEKKEH